jgi:hypothetical protein
VIDRPLIARGADRCSSRRFLLWILPWFGLLGFGLYGAGLCLVKGLNQTNMDNASPSGLIYMDPTVIALSGRVLHRFSALHSRSAALIRDQQRGGDRSSAIAAP